MAVVAPVEGQRIERMPEHARLQQRGDASACHGRVVTGQERVETLAQGFALVASEVVTRVEAGEDAQPPGQPGQLVDVDIPAVGAVLEIVIHRRLPKMGDSRAVDARGSR